MPKTVLKVGNTVLPPPDDISISKNKIWSSNTGRTAAGYTVGDIVARKYKIKASWDTLTAAQAREILNILDRYAFFNVTFIDPYTDTPKTIEIYGGDMEIDVKRYYRNETLYSGLSVSLIER